MSELFKIHNGTLQPTNEFRRAVKKAAGDPVALLDLSIEKWVFVQYPGVTNTGGGSTCALCKAYARGECKRCPIVLVHGEQCTECDNTPYQDWSHDRSPENAQAELDFLRQTKWVLLAHDITHSYPRQAIRLACEMLKNYKIGEWEEHVDALDKRREKEAK